ncbi:hypothetical protein L218DRAFT_1001659 [Marasmius fiardii PR-910]|nr:hypothetical protein L218DRAFT_1001659 [Marasmius fiardii PR-910]
MSNDAAPPDASYPVTPFTFLAPDISNQFEIPRYLYAVTLGGYIWDCAINLESDLQAPVQA